MKKKLTQRKKKKNDAGPLRTCVICRKKRDQNELDRYVSTRDGYEKGRSLPGRGVYVCKSEPCMQKFSTRRKVRH